MIDKELSVLIMILGAIAVALVIAMIIIAMLRKKECNHRFKREEVTDFNIEPRCKKCKYYVSALAKGRRFHFEWVSDDEAKMKIL